MAAVSAPQVTAPRITVLLVDDQVIVGAALRKLLADATDIDLHHCTDPAKALETAAQVTPTVILQDLVMPDIDGLTLVKFFRAHPASKDVPMIVLSGKEEPVTKAKAFAFGANDYLVKFPDKLELLARIRYHAQAYINLLERQEAYRRLAESQKQLAEEVAQASKYVQSLLPAPLTTGRVQAQWRFVPSTTLGGDSFGYHWLDADHFAFYLLDVCGHGVGSALLSVSAMNVLRAQTLPNTDFRQPGQVLSGLNDAFQMEHHDEKYFTIWYGVYHAPTRTLHYCGGGHPAVLLFAGTDPQRLDVRQLDSDGPAIGMWPGAPFEAHSLVLPRVAKLYLYSDGVFEIPKTDGAMWKFEEFIAFMQAIPTDDPAPMDKLLAHGRQLYGQDTLNDDFSMVLLTFGE
jgi:sigma-B regulation protein RsbU (phosphoserine phosphatase)